MNAVDWLHDSDPAIRWQAMRDLTDAPADVVATERAKVATEGCGSALLARQAPDGPWGTELSQEEWTSSPESSCLSALTQLREFGLDPQSTEARRAVDLVRDNVTWHWWDNNPFFVGEVEPCINGRVAAIGAYFGQDSQRVVDRLVGEQMADGGWNCEQENGATVGSFHSTINVLEGLLEHELATGGTEEVKAARLRGQEYLLSRSMFRRLSTGEVVDPAFTQFSYPWGYHYDVLRGLDYLRAAGVAGDERVAEAIDLLKQKRAEDGRWMLENPHPDQMDLYMDEEEGKPSRWVTLRAARVLHWQSGPR